MSRINLNLLTISLFNRMRKSSEEPCVDRRKRHCVHEYNVKIDVTVSVKWI